MSYERHPITMSERHYCVHIDSDLYNGRLDPRRSSNFGFSTQGCPYRGTTTCYRCPFVPVMECDYICGRCDHRFECLCGHDQTVRLLESGVI